MLIPYYMHTVICEIHYVKSFHSFTSVHRFVKQLRVEFLRPEQEFDIVPLLPAASFQLREDAVARVWHKQSETLVFPGHDFSQLFHILREDLRRPLDGAKPHAWFVNLIESSPRTPVGARP